MPPRRVLVVDDDDGIRLLLTRLLGARCALCVAPDAARAREVLADPGRAFDVILSDHDMPGETGLSLLAYAAQVAPGTRRILLSARPPTTARAALDAGVLHGLLEKPFSTGELVALALEESVPAAVGATLEPFHPERRPKADR